MPCWETSCSIALVWRGYFLAKFARVMTFSAHDTNITKLVRTWAFYLTQFQIELKLADSIWVDISNLRILKEPKQSAIILILVQFEYTK